MSPFHPMNHACVFGCAPVPNSAVPVLPCVPGGRPASAAVPDCTTRSISARRVAARDGSSASPSIGGGFCRGSVTRVGECSRPDATAAATRAIVSGETDTEPWPMLSAASWTSSDGGGAEPLYAGNAAGRSWATPRPCAASVSSFGESRRAAPMKAVLHEIEKSVANDGDACVSPSKLRKTRPPTLIVGWHGTFVVGVTPCPNSAYVVTTLNVDPGG